MADESLRRYRAWIRRPARPIVYGPIERWLDWRNGRRDGKNGLPVVPSAPADPTPANVDATAPTQPPAKAPMDRSLVSNVDPTQTQYIQALSRTFLGRAHAERIKLESRTLQLRTRLSRARAEAVAHRLRLSDLETEFKIASEQPTDEDLNVRRAVEVARDRPAYLSRQRRLADHTRVRTTAEKRYNAAEDTCRGAEADVDALTEANNAELRVAAARVRRLREHYLRRTASYLRHLIAHHDRGGELNSLLYPAGPDLPHWAREEPHLVPDLESAEPYHPDAPDKENSP